MMSGYPDVKMTPVRPTPRFQLSLGAILRPSMSLTASSIGRTPRCSIHSFGEGLSAASMTST
jgi:hypothetical protein